jgi:hypothetical protein
VPTSEIVDRRFEEAVEVMARRRGGEGEARCSRCTGSSDDAEQHMPHLGSILCRVFDFQCACEYHIASTISRLGTGPF